MEKRIVIKEIDKLASAVHKDRIVTEYLIYLMQSPYLSNEMALEAHTEFGDDAKNIRVNELLITHFDITDNEIPKGLIEVITFDEYINNLAETLKK